MGVPTQNPPSLTHMGPTLDSCGAMCVGFGGVLVGKPRWGANGRAHTEPTNANTYRPHIGFMWGPCVLVLVGKPTWGANGRAHSEPTKSNTYGPYIGFMWGPCVLYLVGSW